MVNRPAAVWLDQPPAGWNELLRDDPNAGPAHRPELWSAIADTQPGLAVRFAAVGDRAALLGGAAVMIERRGPFRWLHALPHVLPGTPLARAGHHAEVDRAVAAALAALARELAVLGGEWSLYRPRGPAVEADAEAALPGETRRLESAIIELNRGPAAAWRRIDRKTRQAIRRAAAALRFDEEPAALDAAYALHAAQARRSSWRAPAPLPLSQRLLRASGAAAAPARLFTARDARGLLSAALALDHPRETLVWWSGTHPEGRALEAFGFLMWSVVEWAARAGRERVNLGASPGLDPVAAFKRSLGATAVAYPVRWLDASAASLAGRGVAALQRRLRRGRARGTSA